MVVEVCLNSGQIYVQGVAESLIASNQSDVVMVQGIIVLAGCNQLHKDSAKPTGGCARVIKRHVTTLTSASYCIENSTELNFFQLAVERDVKNTENPFRVLLTSNAGELRCWKAY